MNAWKAEVSWLPQIASPKALIRFWLQGHGFYWNSGGRGAGAQLFLNRPKSTWPKTGRNKRVLEFSELERTVKAAQFIPLPPGGAPCPISLPGLICCILSSSRRPTLGLSNICYGKQWMNEWTPGDPLPALGTWDTANCLCIVRVSKVTFHWTGVRYWVTPLKGEPFSAPVT